VQQLRTALIARNIEERVVFLPSASRELPDFVVGLPPGHLGETKARKLAAQWAQELLKRKS